MNGQRLNIGSMETMDLEEAVVDTVMRGGDTDTNAAICGAILGAMWGRNAIPAQWTECVLNCRPAAGQPHVRRPRPKCFWSVDVLELAEGWLGNEDSVIRKSRIVRNARGFVVQTWVAISPRLMCKRESNPRPFSVWGKCGENDFPRRGAENGVLSHCKVL